VPEVIDQAADRTTRRLAGGLRLAPSVAAGSRHEIEFGVDVDAASTSARNQFAGTVHELVDSSQARIWNYDTRSAESRRRVVTTSAYAADRISLSQTLTLDASLRTELVHGYAEGAQTNVNWLSLLPAARLRWQFADRGPIALVGGYVRSANALTLNWLAGIGRPWPESLPRRGPGVLVARVG
jgi:hypothetical protein